MIKHNDKNVKGKYVNRENTLSFKSFFKFSLIFRLSKSITGDFTEDDFQVFLNIQCQSTQESEWKTGREQNIYNPLLFLVASREDHISINGLDKGNFWSKVYLWA